MTAETGSGTGTQKGKAAGLGPAAPMRRRSCRGAGSTTAALAGLYDLQPWSWGGKPPEVLAPGGSHASTVVSGGWEYDRRASQIRSEPLFTVEWRPHAEGPLHGDHVEAERPLRHRHRVHAVLFRP